MKLLCDMVIGVWNSDSKQSNTARSLRA